MPILGMVAQATLNCAVAHVIRYLCPPGRSGRNVRITQLEELTMEWPWKQKRDPDPQEAVAELLGNLEVDIEREQIATEAVLRQIEIRRLADTRLLLQAANTMANRNPVAALGLVRQAALSKVSAQSVREERFSLSMPSEDEAKLAGRVLAQLGNRPALGPTIVHAITESADPPATEADYDHEETVRREARKESDNSGPAFRDDRGYGPRVGVNGTVKSRG